MTTREEFEEVLHGLLEGRYSEYAVMAAWDAQAAEVERLRVEVMRLRAEVELMRGLHSGLVLLTAENAPRARVVEVVERRDGRERHELFTCDTRWGGDGFWSTSDHEGCDAAELIARGATVLAWRKP